jgi:chemotaxis protein MotB
MRLAWPGLAALAIVACGVSIYEYDAKNKELEASKPKVAQLETQNAQLQHQLTQAQERQTGDEQQMTQLKGALGLAQSQAITDDQKAQLEEAQRAMQEAQERRKLLDDLQGKLKRMIDAGHLKVATRHGRVVLQLHNDVLFDKGEVEVKPAGRQAVAEIAATLRGVAGRRFQVAGHTDTEALTPETQKKFPTNWELSTARAIAVVKLLTAEGVDPTMLSAAGYGPYDPVASNGAAEGQAKNRRIEIVLVPNVGSLVTAARTAAPSASH